MSKKNIDEVAKAMDLIEVNTHALIEDLKQDILMSMYRVESGKKLTDFERNLNKKIEKLYSEWNNGAEFYYDPYKKNLSMFLMGPPGQGKTTTFKVAGAEVAEALGLNFIINPDDNYKPSENDFLFVSLECSGENSAITFGGMPAKVEETGPNGEKIVYMTKVPSKRMAVLSHVAGGVLLLDDFSNAAPNVQNVALSLTDEKRFQGLSFKHTLIGLTGNLGSVDGTHTTKNSSALSSRVKLVMVKDELKNFIARTQNKFKNDDIGDAGVNAFLNRNPECFAEMPDTKKGGGFPCPRTWDHFMSETRSFIQRSGGRGKGERVALEKIKDYAKIILGSETGLKVASYYHSLVQGADPVAQQAIVFNKFDKKGFEEKYGTGKSAPQQDFGYQLAVAASDYTIQLIRNDPKHDVEEPIKRFGKLILLLNPTEFAYAVDCLKDKLAIQVPELSVESKSNKLERKLKEEVKVEICQVISKLDDADYDKLETIVNAITNYDKLDSSMVKRSSRRVAR